jgi:hypothetical protein
MTTYAKYRILLFSLESTDGNFLCVDNLEDGCSAIETKAVFDEMRRTADVVDVGGSSPVARSRNRLVRMQRNPSRMPRDSLVRRRGGHWRGWRDESGIQQKPLTGRAKCVMRPDQGQESQTWEETKPE